MIHTFREESPSQKGLKVLQMDKYPHQKGGGGSSSHKTMLNNIKLNLKIK